MPSSVAVAVVTYRRASQLTRLLDSIAQLERPPGGEDEPTVVVVIDNDADGSAEATVDMFRSASGNRVEVRYAVEATPGIAAARNAAIALACDRGAIAFIDDDEVPAPNWLSELLDAQVRYDADVVAGPAYPV